MGRVFYVLYIGNGCLMASYFKSSEFPMTVEDYRIIKKV